MELHTDSHLQTHIKITAPGKPHGTVLRSYVCTNQHCAAQAVQGTHDLLRGADGLRRSQEEATH